MLHHDSDKLQALISAFKSAEQQVHTVLFDTDADDIKGLQVKLNKKLDKVNIGLIKKSMSWAKSDIPAAYKEGVKNIDGKVPRSLRADGTDVANSYIQLANQVQHATDHAKDVISSAIEQAEKESPYGATVGGVKDIIQKTLAEENSSMIITYNNGAQMPLPKYAEMLARTSRIMSANTGAFDRCKQLGIDLVRCTTVPGCCPYCKKYEGKVYSISGNDKRFPALYETALQRGYNIMHPNCRHEFIPFVEELETPEELQRIIKESNHFEDFDKNDNMFKIYNRNQALQRQWVDESREFHRLQDTLGDKMPYKTLGGFRRARRARTTEYKKIHYHNRDEKLYNSWKDTVGENNMPETLDKFQEIRYNDDKEYRRLQSYKDSIGGGKLSPLVDYKLYKSESERIATEIVGQTTSNGIEIKGVSKHFYERYFGSVEDRREGVPFEAVKDCITKGKAEDVRTDKKGRVSQVFTIEGVAQVSINPTTGEIIQVNPFKKKAKKV